MKVLDLFSGIGGFSLGLERAGMETIAFCEIEDYPVTILNKHWPNIPVHRDIRKLDGRQYNGSIDLVCGGFPCQGFSVAGKQKGKADDRYLWPEMFRIIKESKPTWVIGENVVGIIKLALDDVLSDLESEGYTAIPFVISASAVGGLHRRERVWIVAYAEYNGFSATENGRSKQKAVCRSSEGQDETLKSTRICTSENVANFESTGLEGPAGTKQAKKGRAQQVRSVPENHFSRDWKPIRQPTQSTICSRVNGVPDRVARLKALGNAVVPQIPELIGRTIMGFTNEKL